MYYSDYLDLDKILNAQFPESEKVGVPAEDEMLFIIIHQTYELWFKQIIYEVNLVIDIFNKPELDDVAGDVSRAAHKLNRCIEILKILVAQIEVMETMTPLDFLDFRDLLRPASGFQSVQFKILEARLGLKFDARYGQGYYLTQLREGDVERVKRAEDEVSLKTLINKWLERMPYLSTEYWPEGSQTFWDQYIAAYSADLVKGEEHNVEAMKKYLFDEAPVEGRTFSPLALQNALFIMCYRDFPRLRQPWIILDLLNDVDEKMALWRFRHLSMVRKTIGGRVGTGGSTGAQYLKAATDSHYIFKDLQALTTFLVSRSRLPHLPQNLTQDLGDFWK